MSLAGVLVLVVVGAQPVVITVLPRFDEAVAKFPCATADGGSPRVFCLNRLEVSLRAPQMPTLVNQMRVVDRVDGRTLLTMQVYGQLVGAVGYRVYFTTGVDSVSEFDLTGVFSLSSTAPEPEPVLVASLYCGTEGSQELLAVVGSTGLCITLPETPRDPLRFSDARPTFNHHTCTVPAVSFTRKGPLLTIEPRALTRRCRDLVQARAGPR